MKWGWRKAVTVVVLLTIIYVFVSPMFALEYSANRAWHAALQLMLTIASMIILPFAISEEIVRLALVPESSPLRGSPDPLSLISISRC